jgi:hypothetical protein
LQALREREAATEVKTLERVNRCQFCGKTFVRKSWAARHTCTKKRKFEASVDVNVQYAYRLYTYWMQRQKLAKRGKDPSFEKFLSSPIKSAFCKLVTFCSEQDITSPYSYVDWLIVTGKPERTWYDDSSIILDKFRTFTTENEDPLAQATQTLMYIERWLLEDETRTPEEFFDKLTPGMILTLVRQRKIQPWPLFTYDPIVSRWLDKGVYNADVFFRIDGVVNCDYWANKIAESPETAVAVTTIMDQIWQYQT